MSMAGTFAIGCNMSDILILVSRSGVKASVTGLTDRGINWIRTNMHCSSPTVIHKDVVNEFAQDIEKDGLTVQIR